MNAIENINTAKWFTSTFNHWEDFGQLLGIYHFNKVTEPVNSAERQTSIMLDMLDETNSKATFLILGMLAKYRPGLVKEIAARGHEIAIHGQNHKAMFSLTKDDARKRPRNVLDIVSGVTGEKVYGYRAPFFSVNESNLSLFSNCWQSSGLNTTAVYFQ